MLAVGGALGGFFVGVIAPYFFNSNYELSIGIVLTGLVTAIAIIPDVRFARPAWRIAAIGGTLAFLVALSWIRIVDHHEESGGAEASLRNFYGTLKVFDNAEKGYRTMLHGQIIHGRQLLAPDKILQPTTYYSPDGGAGRALQIKAGSGPLRVGVVGLGVGTLVGYGRKGDYYRLYEIDPLVIDVAREHFSFLSQTAAQTEIILGDARLQLDNETSQQFDVLVVDAFSGDSVPVHLLTREAFALYFRHLKPDGVLAVHITNRFLDLRPVIKTAADHFARDVRIVDVEGSQERGVFRSRWALISGDAAFFRHAALQDAQPIADLHQAVWLGRLVVHFHFAAFAGSLGLRACVEKARDVEPDVEADDRAVDHLVHREPRPAGFALSERRPGLVRFAGLPGDRARRARLCPAHARERQAAVALGREARREHRGCGLALPPSRDPCHRVRDARRVRARAGRRFAGE